MYLFGMHACSAYAHAYTSLPHCVCSLRRLNCMVLNMITYALTVALTHSFKSCLYVNVPMSSATHIHERVLHIRLFFKASMLVSNLPSHMQKYDALISPTYFFFAFCMLGRQNEHKTVRIATCVLKEDSKPRVVMFFNSGIS